MGSQEVFVWMTMGNHVVSFWKPGGSHGVFLKAWRRAGTSRGLGLTTGGYVNPLSGSSDLDTFPVQSVAEE